MPGPGPRPDMPPHGWRTQFWVADQQGARAGRPASAGTARWHPAQHCRQRRDRRGGDRLAGRATHAQHGYQFRPPAKKRTSWLIVALATLLAALATFPLARGLLAPVKRLVEGTHKLAAGDFSTRVTVTGGDELGRLAQDFNQLASTLERNQQMRRDLMADISHELRTPLAVLRGELEAIQGRRA